MTKHLDTQTQTQVNIMKPTNISSCHTRVAAALIMLIFEQPNRTIDQEIEATTLAEIKEEQSISTPKREMWD